jgi:hypothetical protein
MLHVVGIRSKTEIVRVFKIFDLVELAQRFVPIAESAMQLALADPFSFSSTATRLLMSLKTDSSPSFVPRTRSTRRVFSSFRCSSSCRTNEAVCRSSSNTGAIGSPFSYEALYAAHGSQGEISKMGALLTTRKLALDKGKPKARTDYEDRFERFVP